MGQEPDRDDEPHAVFESLSRQITQARREMGEARWAELNAEWEV